MRAFRKSIITRRLLKNNLHGNKKKYNKNTSKKIMPLPLKIVIVTGINNGEPPFACSNGWTPRNLRRFRGLGLGFGVREVDASSSVSVLLHSPSLIIGGC